MKLAEVEGATTENIFTSFALWKNLISFNDLSGDFSFVFCFVQKIRLRAAEGVEDVKHLTVKVDKANQRDFSLLALFRNS